MRQAGRYMPQYRKLRQRHSILDLCHNPELAAEVTLQPVARLGVDAAIVFADILLPFEALRLGLSFKAGEGPHIDRPIRDATDVERLPAFNVDAELGYVMEAIRLARRELPGDVPLIGFAGAPFTLASYAIEGGASRTFTKTKRLMYQAPD
ncbi:MAG TPA: uroporphyrinogen decarboxylase family protein, partial [Gemmatimonadales bacterium]|nr:uroporphyrinogen decarboxylase family protein [Gemmatimonadales bacterium]